MCHPVVLRKPRKFSASWPSKPQICFCVNAAEYLIFEFRISIHISTAFYTVPVMCLSFVSLTLFYLPFRVIPSKAKQRKLFFFFFVMKQWNSIKHMLKSLLWTYIFSFIFSPQILLATVRALFTSITHLLHEHVKVFWEWFFSLCSHNGSKHNLFLFVWASDHQCSLTLSFYVITEMMHRCQGDFAVTTIFVFPLVFYLFFYFLGELQSCCQDREK